MPNNQEPNHPPSSDRKNMDARESILDLISSHYLNSDYSDLMIICNGKTLLAHRLVVCPRSEYFKSACLGGFKEAKEPVCLDNRDPVLIEKVLEFLYTGSYTIGYLAPEVRSPPFPRDRGLKLDTEQTSEPVVSCIPGEHAPAEPTPAAEANNETTTSSPENIALDLVDDKDPSDQADDVDAVGDTSADCHASYFHLRIFAEADYFMISDLKDRAKEQFHASFMDCSDRNLFAEVIEELYSNRANYQELRKLAIDVVIDNLPNLQNESVPAIDSELVEAVPGFASDLCLATVKKYVSDPPSMKPDPFATGFKYKTVQSFGATDLSFRNQSVL